MEPDQSLILLKATSKVPHEGGVRFRAEAREYQILRQWIEAGTPRDGEGGAEALKLVKLEVTPSEQVVVEPADGVKITATAVYSDGSRRDGGMLRFRQASRPWRWQRPNCRN